MIVTRDRDRCAVLGNRRRDARAHRRPRSRSVTTPARRSGVGAALDRRHRRHRAPGCRRRCPWCATASSWVMTPWHARRSRWWRAPSLSQAVGAHQIGRVEVDRERPTRRRVADLRGLLFSYDETKQCTADAVDRCTGTWHHLREAVAHRKVPIGSDGVHLTRKCARSGSTLASVPAELAHHACGRRRCDLRHRRAPMRTRVSSLSPAFARPTASPRSR